MGSIEAIMAFHNPMGLGDPMTPTWDGEHSMGTTIMAVKYDGDGGGVVMGADSRTSTGSYVANRVSDKITPVCGNVAVCRSGSAADTQALTDYVKLIVGGWDKYNKGSVWTIPLGGGMVEQQFSLGGSGSGYIYGYCDANYREGMTQAECEEFVRNAVSLAMSRDGSSGGVIRTMTINQHGCEKKYTPGDKLPFPPQGP